MAKDTESVVVDSYPANDEHPSLPKRLQVAHNPSLYAPSSKWSNQDMDPTPPEDRTWVAWDYFAYWICDAFSRSRSSFDHLSDSFSPDSQLDVGAVTGGQSMQQLINAIWPSFRNVPNHLPDNIGMTTASMCAYIIYFVIQFPFLIVPYTKIRWFFHVKAIIAPVVMITIMGPKWAVASTADTSSHCDLTQARSLTEFRYILIGGGTSIEDIKPGKSQYDGFLLLLRLLPTYKSANIHRLQVARMTHPS
ncbi:hypothetical protein EDD85DRAFT_793220 [Armillaria nabsnona]|nr:hypothetical protein EDD85DRAFT_793220 [Armillaria nabsnona]